MQYTTKNKYNKRKKEKYNFHYKDLLIWNRILQAGHFPKNIQA